MTTRSVLVVGPQATIEPPLHVLTSSDRLLVIAIGWPLSNPQRRITDLLQSAAMTAGCVFEGALVASSRDVAGLLREGDVVHALVGRHDASRLRKAGVPFSAPVAP